MKPRPCRAGCCRYSVGTRCACVAFGRDVCVGRILCVANQKGGVAKMSGDKMMSMSGAAKKAGSAGKAVMGSSGKGTKTMNLPASGKGKMSAGFAKGGS